MSWAGLHIDRIRAPLGAVRMEIDWSDGHRSAYSHALLRGFCPCAGCQGHQGPIRYRVPPSPPASTAVPLAVRPYYELREIEEVGSYALRLRWGDGHDAGIFSFAFLRALCPCSECLGGQSAEARHFSR